MAFVINDPLPQDCTECDYRCGLNIIARTGDYAEGCPIIGEIPGKHGRLIDVDEFKASIHMNHLGKFATNRDVQVLYKLLNNAPTIMKATE